MTTETWTFDRYEILRTEEHLDWDLGESPFCRSFKGWDSRLGRPVFLHMLKDECSGIPEITELFASSARSLSAVANSRVAAVRDLLPEEGPIMCAVEYFDGEFLDDFLRRTKGVDAVSAVELTAQGAKILRALWESGLAMVDFRPGLFLLSYEGDEPLLRMVDGLVSPTAEGAAGHGVHLSLAMPVQPHFSPEQREGGDFDIRANIFSLGVLMHELLAGGQAPVFGQDGGPSFQALRGVPHAILDVLGKMLEPSPEHRFQTPAELVWALDHCSAGGGAARVPLERAPEISPVPDEKRFRPIEALDDAGRFVEAQDLRDGGRVLLHRFAAELTAADHEEIRIATVLRAFPEKHIVRPLEIVSEGENPCVAYEWLHGFSLLDVLQKRQRIPLEECVGFLEVIATALDHAALRGVPGLDTSLAGIRFHFEGILSRGQLLSLAGTASPGWPVFVIKLVPAAAAWGFSSQRAASPSDAGGIVQAFGNIVCQLLGGRLPGPQFSPIAGLPEPVNAVLAKCFRSGTAGYAQAREIVAELRLASGQLSTASAAVSEFSGPYADSVPAARPRDAAAPVPAPSPEGKRGSGLRIIAIVAVLALSGAGAVVGIPGLRDQVGEGMTRARRWIFPEKSASDSSRDQRPKPARFNGESAPDGKTSE